MAEKTWKKYYDKEYFRDKQRERRKNDPLTQKQNVYIAIINGKKYAFLKKSHIQITKMSVNDFKQQESDMIRCF